MSAAFDHTALRATTMADIARLQREALEVFTTLVLPTWSGELHGFSQTLYGYMLRVFSIVDLLSCYWRPPGVPSDNQTIRMVDFLERYMGYPRDALNAATQIWRHKLAHTSRPRPLTDAGTHTTVRWLLQWYAPHLSREQHFTFSGGSGERILNLGAIYLIEDLEHAADAYFVDLSGSSALQASAARFDVELSTYQLRPV